MHLVTDGNEIENDIIIIYSFYIDTHYFEVIGVKKTLKNGIVFYLNARFIGKHPAVVR